MADSKLVERIAQEAKELAAVPKIPIAQFIGGSWQRCHICGGMFPKAELVAFDRVRVTYRLACKGCRRNSQ